MVDVLDIRKLRMLAELDRLGTITAAARSLHLTAPGVSMQLAALEREVGLTLTERRGRTLTLTPAGRLLARHGHDIVDRLTLVELEVDALREGAAGTYRVAAFPSIARTVVADTWATLLRAPEPEIALELIELEPQDSLPALRNGEVEIAVTHSYSNLSRAAADGLVIAELAVEPVWLAVPRRPAIASDRTEPGDVRVVDLEDFAAHDWVLPHSKWSCHEMVQRACGLAGFAPHAVAEASDFAVLLALVGAGAGVALVPQLTIASLPDTVTLHPLSAPIVRRDWVVSREASAADPGVQRVRQLLADSAARWDLTRPPRRTAQAGGRM